jgi:pimeloyl-ACP methyl ester carboxylesterase
MQNAKMYSSAPASGTMQTPIDLPDPLASAADALARRLGVSLADLCAAAVGEFVAKHTAVRAPSPVAWLYAEEPGPLDAAWS